MKLIFKCIILILVVLIIIGIIYKNRVAKYFINNRSQPGEFPVKIYIESNPAGADIYIDDVIVGHTNKQLFKLPGEYNLRLISNNYKPINKIIKVSKDSANYWLFNLKRKIYNLSVQTSPKVARVYINGVLKAKESIKLTSGKYRVEVRSVGYYPKKRIINLHSDLNTTFKLNQKVGNLKLEIEPKKAQVIMMQGNKQIDPWIGSIYKKDVPIGKYKLRFVLCGYNNQTRAISVKEKRTTRLSIKMEKDRTPNKIVSSVSSKSIPTFPSFTTDTLIDIDFNIYKIVKIGDQWWMAENLKVTRYRNGDPIPKVSDVTQWSDLTTGAYCNYDNNDSSMYLYGNLYNWYAVSDGRKIAPKGWHVPSDNDWRELELCLGMSDHKTDDYGWRGTDQGDLLLQSGNSNSVDPSNNTSKSIFSGCRNVYGFYFFERSYAYFWSSTEHYNTSAWARRLSCSRSDIYRYYYNKNYGFAVRCVKN